MASADAIRAGEAVVSLSADDRLFNRALSRFAGRVRGLGQELRRLAGAGVGLGFAMTPVVSTFVRFDDAIRQAGAKATATADEFDRMEEHALLLGRTTSFTAAQVADLMTELGTAGFKPDQIIAATGAVLDLARATGTDAALSAKIAAAAINQFGLKAEDSARVADSLTAAANMSATTMEDLGYALTYTGQDAHRLGMSLEDTLAVLGQLANMGMRGEQSGTTLRRLLTLTGAEAEKLHQIFGVTATDARGDLLPLVDVLEQVGKSLEGLGTAEATAKLKDFFGILGITGASAVAEGAAGIRELATGIKGSAGVANRTARQMDAGVGGSWRRLKSAAEGSAIALGKSLAPALAMVAALIEDASGKVTEWIGRNRELATGIGALVVGFLALAAAGAGLLGLGLAFTAALAPVTAVLAGVRLLGAATVLAAAGGLRAVRLLGAGLWLLLNPVGRTVRLAVAGFAAVRAAVLAAAASVAAFRAAAIAAYAALAAPAIALFAVKLAVAGAVLAGLVYLLPRLGETLGHVFRRIGQAAAGIARTLAEAFGGIIAAVKKGDLNLAWEIALKGLEISWLHVVEALRGAWYDFTNFFRDTFREAVLAVQDLGLGVAAAVKVGFLNTLIGIANAINDTQARVLNLGQSEREAARRKAQPELTPVEQDLDAELVRRGREQKKIDTIKAGIKARGDPFAAPTLGETVKILNQNKLDEETVAALENNIKVSQDRSAKLARKFADTLNRYLLGEKFIDTSGMEAARDAVETEGEKLMKAVAEADRKEREARDAGQRERLDQLRREREELGRELARLVGLANAPAPELGPMPRVAGALPVAPMPHRPGAGRRAEERFGDAARGLFQSGDFKGALGIGPAKDMQGKQLDATKGITEALRNEIKPLLQSIERKTEPAVFT